MVINCTVRKEKNQDIRRAKLRTINKSDTYSASAALMPDALPGGFQGVRPRGQKADPPFQDPGSPSTPATPALVAHAQGGLTLGPREG
jgi:hypothetical protein